MLLDICFIWPKVLRISMGMKLRAYHFWDYDICIFYVECVIIKFSAKAVAAATEWGTASRIPTMTQRQGLNYSYR